MGWIIALIVVVVLGVGGAIGWQYIAREHREAMSLPLNAVDFSKLADGVYTGEYEGGMYKWRTNSVEVTVEGGKVTAITLLASKFGEDPVKYVDPLYTQVVDKQTLQVDAVSGSTLTSKAALQAIENALVQAME
ncbi:MAG TPA: FMN-binding protein [Candidatus Limiplasma sp.]|nr:FMN-binding protein [Candidatus Limiplasma sp.]HRX07899.1 FMN-binding protein [Candidatus Limiplasma sp.]